MSCDNRPSGLPENMVPEWQVGTYAWWPKSDRVIWSPELVRLYGLDEAPTAERHFTVHVHPEDRVRVEAETSFYLGSDASRYSHSFRIVRPDGAVRRILDRGAIERDLTGQVRVIRGMNIDITEAAAAGTSGPPPQPAPRPAEGTALRDALQAASSVVFSWDIRADRVQLTVAEETLRHLANERPETIEQIVETIHPDDRAAFRAAIEGALGSRDGAYSSEHRIVGPGGEARHFTARGRVQFNNDGTPLRLLGVSHDITERKRIEGELAEAKALLDALFDSAPVGLGLWDTDFRFLRVNRHLADLNGVSPEGHVGRRPDEILPGLTDFEAIYRQWHRVLETGVPLRGVEISGETPADPGHTRHWVEDFFPVRMGARNIGIAALIQETTRSKAAEEGLRVSELRYRALFDALDQGFCVVEVRLDAPDGRVDYRVVEANRAFYDRTGFPESILGQWLREAAPDLEEHWFDTYGRVAATGEPIRFEQKSDMLGRWFDVYAFRIDAPQEGRVGILLSDISRRKQEEDRLHLFMREMNHRSKNMLNLIQAVARQTLSVGPENFLARFGERVRALAAAQELLFEHAWTTVPIDDLVRSQLAHFSDLVGGRIALAGPPLWMKPDAAQAVGMALHELATNAAKYGALSDGAGRIAIEWAVDPAREPERRFTMSWREHGGPAVQRPTRRGFGTRVTTEMVEASTGGDVVLDHAATGLEWRLCCRPTNVLDETPAV